MPDGSILGVTPSANASTQLLFQTNSVFPSLANAASIGGLAENSTELSTMGQLDSNVSSTYYKFNLESGDNLKLNFTNQTNTSSLQVQVLNSTGTVIADNYGTPAQQAAYAQLNSSTGLTQGTGTYYVKVAYAPNGGTTTPAPQSYNFQLLSGSTYNNSIVTSTQTQAYDPNLFVAAATTVNPSSNLSLYTQTATLSATPSAATATNVGDLQANQTELDGVGSITNANRTDYYSFNFSQGNAIKLAVANTTNALDATSLHVQLMDSTGKVVADNQGTTAQQNAYTELASGEGLSAANGNYTLKVEATPGAVVTATQSYNFQLMAGTSYSTVYKTSAELPGTGGDTLGTNLNVFADSQAQLYSRSGYNSIGETANSGNNIGWLSQNSSALEVNSQVTAADNADWYSFTLQPGNDQSADVPIKMAFANTTATTDLRVQLYDVSGLHVIADNKGTPAQQAAFAQLTSSTGYSAPPAEYNVKISYAEGANTTDPQSYNFQLYSGDRYENMYETVASAQTIENAVLEGNTSVAGSFSAASSAAAYLQQLSNGSTEDITTALSATVA